MNSDGLQYAWVPRGDNLNLARLKPAEKYGGGSTMIWGCMTYAGVRTNGRMNTEVYVQILERCLVPTLKASNLLEDFPTQEQLIFQQDNDAKHTSRRARG